MRTFALLPLTLLLACPADPPKDSTSADDLDADGWTVLEGDCDDYDAGLNPDENEVWYDGEDQDCDGNDDDQDEDGYAIEDDCADTDPARHPGAAETCNEIDDDCDGVVDVGVSGSATLYPDLDGDGYGDDTAGVEACEGEGWTDVGGDCDDADAAVSPAAQEVCNDVDDDCDGEVNEGQPDEVSYYLDADQDGYGDPSDVVTACETPVGYVANGEDCDDLDGAIHPLAEETCDDVDADCDGDPTNGAVDAATWYDDADGDGFGDPDTALISCTDPGDRIEDGTDCDDTEAEVNPAAVEVCDEVDNDCSGAADEGLTTTLYADTDADGFGDAASAAELCALEDGWVDDSSDCDDGDPETWPGAEEVCDLEDNDCDGSVDDGATDPRTYYVDADSDGYGDAGTSTEACGAPTGYSDVSTDCDDADGAVNPGAAEVCDGLDQDCDDVADDDATDALTWYADDDGDAFGDAGDTLAACDAPTGYVADDTDCDDARAGSNPDALEICADGSDNDCDGATDEDDASDAGTWYADGDSDGYGDAATSTVACEGPSGYVATGDDCDDADSAVSPGATETCNAVDDDCDGDADEAGADGELTWYRDADADGWGVATTTTAACDAPSGYASDLGDCDDADAAAYPGATEADDLLDNDCDGWTDEDSVVAGDLVFSEVTRQPRLGASSTTSDGYWFEVYNASSRTLDLSNWYVQRTSSVGTDAWYVDPDEALTVAAGDYLVFCKTDDYTAASQPSYSTLGCDYVWGDESQASTYTGTYHDNTFNLQRDEDTLQVYVRGDSGTGTLVDEVHWVWSSTGTQWPRTAQYSMSLHDGALDATDNDDVTNWCLADSGDTWWDVTSTNREYGTPGAGNGLCF